MFVVELCSALIVQIVIHTWYNICVERKERLSYQYGPTYRRQRYTGRGGIRQILFPRAGRQFLIFPRAATIIRGKTITFMNNSVFLQKTVTAGGGRTSLGESSICSSDQDFPLESAESGSIDGASSEGGVSKDSIDPPVLVYHENARSIVFRDHLRRATDANELAQQQLEQQELLRLREREEKSQNFLNEIISTVSFEPIPPKRYTTTAYMTEIFDARKEHHHHHHHHHAIPTNPHHEKTKTDIDSHDSKQPQQMIANFQPIIKPLPQLELSRNDTFQALLQQSTISNNGEKDAEGFVPQDKIPEEWTMAEREVVHMLQTQKAVVKTIKNVDWTDFLRRFHFPNKKHRLPKEHVDISPHEGFPFNSFMTSTSLLPRNGKKMRAYGSPTLYTTGVVFALPTSFGTETEDEAAKRTKTWSWPAGYAAKTEFNIDSAGFLVNGREEAMEKISVLRQYNDDYIHKEDYIVGHRVVKGGLNEIPYNEIFVRVGGRGRIVDGNDSACGKHVDRSFEKGIGLPVALFVRMATFGHMISLIRTRARLVHVLGESHVGNIPLLLISPELGLRVVTESLQRELLSIAARNLNPFQNPVIAHKTKMGETSDLEFEQKLEELIDLDEPIRKMLTPEECARLAGGFGATDDSVATILKEAMLADKRVRHENKARDGDGDGDDDELGAPMKEGHQLQDIVNEGLASAVRAGDYYTSRQLLILYTLVASMGNEMDTEKDDEKEENNSGDAAAASASAVATDAQGNKKLPSDLGVEVQEIRKLTRSEDSSISALRKIIPKAPPPPPLDTDRLRGATNCDGLLAVLGAAQVLKAMQDGSAKRRTQESVLAVEEWIEHGEQSMAFRVASWYDQRAAQNDLKIAMQNDSSFLAFVSNKAISNRRAFAKQLRYTIDGTDFTDVQFLEAVHGILRKMHSPCLRLELLQYVLGLDNRYSVAHVARSVELAATCLGISDGSVTTMRKA